MKFTYKEFTEKQLERKKWKERIHKTTSPEYAEYLSSNAWAELRLAVWKRDKFRCVKCGSHKGIQVHHLTYKNFKHEELEDLETICDSCHRKEHGK